MLEDLIACCMHLILEEWQFYLSEEIKRARTAGMMNLSLLPMHYMISILKTLKKKGR